MYISSVEDFRKKLYGDKPPVRTVEKYIKAEAAPARGFLKEAASALGAGVISTAESIAGTYEMLGLPGGKIAKGYWGEVGEHEALRRPSYLQEETVWENPDRLMDWRWWTRSLGENIPNMAAAVLPGLGALKGAKLLGWGSRAMKLAGTVGFWTGAATIEAGAAYNQAKEEMKQMGYTEQDIERTATVEGITVGIVNGLLESYPFKVLFLNKLKAANPVARVVKRLVRQAWIEGKTETVQEGVNILAEKLGHKPDLEWKDNIGRLLESGIIGFALGGGAGATLGKYAAEEEIGEKREEREEDQGMSDSVHMATDIGQEPIIKTTLTERLAEREKENIRKKASDLIDSIIIDEEEHAAEQAVVREPGIETAEKAMEEPPEPVFEGPPDLRRAGPLAEAPRGIIPLEETWNSTPADIGDEWSQAMEYIERIKVFAQPRIKGLQDEYNSIKGKRDKESIERKKEIKKEVDNLKSDYEDLFAYYENKALDESLRLRDEAEKKAKSIGITDEVELENFLIDFQAESSQERPYIERNWKKTFNRIFDEVAEDFLPEAKKAEIIPGEEKKEEAIPEEKKPIEEKKIAKKPPSQAVAALTGKEVKEETPTVFKIGDYVTLRGGFDAPTTAEFTGKVSHINTDSYGNQDLSIDGGRHFSAMNFKLTKSPKPTSQAVAAITGKKVKKEIPELKVSPKEEKIIENAFKDKTPAKETGEKPNLMLMGGPSGCGKSTVILNGKRKNYVIIDADGIHKDLGGKRGENLHEDASRIAKTILKRATDEGYHIVYDNRLGNYELSNRMIKRTLDNDGEAIIFFVDIDAVTSAVRTHFRYVTGERLWKLPDKQLLDGYNRALPTFLELYKNYKDNKDVKFNFIINDKDFEQPIKVIENNKIINQKKLDDLLKTDYIKVKTEDGGIRYERKEKASIGLLKKAETKINERVNFCLIHEGSYELTQAERFETGKEISEAELGKRLARIRSGKPPGEPVLPAEAPLPVGERAAEREGPLPGEEVEVAPGERGAKGGERLLPAGTEGPIGRPGGRADIGRHGGPIGRPGTKPGTSRTPPGRPARKDIGKRPERVEDQNHRIEKEDVLIPPGKVSRINANISAIKLLKKLESEKRNPTTEEKKILAQFTGWGALAQDVFKHEHKIDRYEDVAEKPYYLEEKEWIDWLKWRSKTGKQLHPKLGGILTQEEWDAAKASTLNAFYTNQEIIDHGLWALAKRLGIKEGTIIDPAGGIGHIFGLMPKSMEGKVQLVGVELDTISGKILKKLYPEANIQITGFEKAKGIPDNSIDLVVSNFPFGDYGVFDKQHPDYSGWSIHNYFFARSIDIAKPGGMVIAITSHYTLDAVKSGKVREYLSKKADLIGAIRLPATAFEKSAGTSVTTDILVFRKKDSNPFPFAQSFRTIVEIPIGKNKSVNVNEYFEEHPEMVLGEHSLAGKMQAGREEYTLLPFKDRSIEDQLDRVVPFFPAAIAGEGSVEQVGTIEEGIEGFKEGSLVESRGKVFLLDENGLLIPPDWADNETKIERARSYINVREATKKLIDAQRNPLEDEEHIESLRADLNRVYDNFRKKYNALGEDVNSFLDDDIEYPVVLALENVVQGFKEVTVKGKKQKRFIPVYEKSDIFFKRTIFPFEEPTEADSIKDALNISIIYRNTLDTVFIADLAKITPEEAKAQLLDQGLAFENPETGLLETTEEYLSGNVKKKLKTAKLQAAENPAYERNIKALEDVQPEDLGIDQIHFRLGSVWIPTDIIESFVDDLLDVNANVNYTDTGDTSRWQVQPNYGQANAKNQTTWGMEGADGIRLIQDCLNLKGTAIFRYEENPEDPSRSKKVKDSERTLTAHQKQKDIQAEFVKWVKANKEIINRLEPIYNDNCNNSIVKKHNIPDIDYYPNASHEVKLHDGQKRAIARALQESCIFVHATGFGKTYSIITAAMEMRRIGTAKKPMIVVQNATVPQYARLFKKLYPAAKVLIPNNKQRDAKHRQRLLGKITTGDWDAVIIPHSFFDLLANDPEIESRYIREQIAELEARLITAAEQEGRRSPTVKQLEKAKERKANRLTQLASLKKDVAIWFEQLGIDALFIDESHAYKRGEFYTKMDNVKGIDKGASMRSFRLLMKVRSVQEKTGGKNVIFSTATPISNTMTELWSIVRNIRPNLLEEYHINQFDDFASTFGMIRDDIEETATGDFKNIERFATFVNGPELLTMWKNCSDVVLAEDVKLLNVPKVKGGKPTEIKLTRTEELTVFIQELKARRKAWDELKGREKMEQRHVPLLIFNQARQAAIDLRLVNSDAEDSPGSKTNEVVGKVYDVWEKSKSIKGTQLVFSDLYQSPDGKFNLYKDIRDKLIEKGISIEEIAIIHNYNTDVKKAELFQKVKNGDVRVVFGSTGKLGIGVSVQQRMVAIHHVDAPLRPMDFEQRNGRLVRQGNMNDEVEIFVYGVKNTLDSVTYQILQYKQKFINQALRGDIKERTFEDPSNATQLTFEEMMAAFSGNPLVRERYGLENKVRKLEILKANYLQERTDTRAKIRSLEERQIPNQKEAIKEAEAYRKEFEDKIPDNKVETLVFEDIEYERKEIGKKLDEIVEIAKKDLGKRLKTADINEYGHIPESLKDYFDLIFNDNVNVVLTIEPKVVISREKKKLKIFLEGFLINYRVAIVDKWSWGRSINTGNGLIRSLESFVAEIKRQPDISKAQLKTMEKNLAELNNVMEKEFEQEDELKEAKIQLSEVLTQLEVSEDIDARIVKEIGTEEKRPVATAYHVFIGGKYQPVKGEKVEVIPWAETFIFKEETGAWNVIESTTGISIALRNTKKGAIEQAFKNLNFKGQAKTKEIIKEHIEKYGESPWVKGEAIGPQYKVGITPVAEITGLSLEDIQAVFKGQDIKRTPEGYIRVTTKYGGSVEIRTVDWIDADNVAFNMAYGRIKKAGEVVIGKYEDRRIDLHRDLAGRWTLTHESYHFMENAGIISKSDIKVLQNKIRAMAKQGKFTPYDEANVGFAEDRAAWVTDQLADIYDVKSTTGKIVLKIRIFLDRLLDAFGIRTAGAITRRIETGRIFEEPVKIPEGIEEKDLKVADQAFFAIAKPETGPDGTEEIEKNRSFVNKLFEMGDLARHRVGTEIQKLQRQVQDLTGKPSRKRIHLGIGYQPKLKRSMASDDLDRAMMIYRDLKNNPDKAQEFREWADKALKDPKISSQRKIIIKKQQKVLDSALSLTGNQKEFVSYMGGLFEDAYKKAKAHKIVQTHRDNYVRRIWKLPRGMEDQFTGSGSGYGFKTFTSAAMPRTFETILDGWINGYELKVEGITNSYERYMTDLVTIVSNKAFIQRGVDTKDTNSNSLFSTTSSLPGYKALNATGFSVWRWAGKAEVEAEFGDEEALIVDTYGRKFFATPPERIPGAWSVYKDEKQKRPVETFDSIVEANIFAQKEGYERIERNIPKDISEIFQKQPLYAPAPLADMINKMTATENWIYKIPSAKQLLRLNTGLKSWILLSSFFHHMAGTRSWVFGVHHGWKKANPVKAYKDGLAKIEDCHPLIDLGIKNGLTLGEMQDWSEHELREQKGLTESLVNYLGLEKMEKAIQFGKFYRQKFTDSLFKKFFAGLKAEAFVIEYTHELQKAQEKYSKGKSANPPIAEAIAERVARLINADFGGLHLKRMGRNPTLQKIFRLLLLAPDWTESNFKTVYGMFPGLHDKINKLVGDVPSPPGQHKIFRKFWGRVILRIAVMTILAQMILNGKDETEEYLEEQMMSNRWNKFRWTELEITKLYRMLGIDTEGQRMTFSLGGHFFDPLKLIDPPRLIKHKGSPLMRLIGAFGTGTDWAERPFTGVRELVKTGKTIKKSAYQEKEGAYNRLPATVVNQVINMQPIQLGHFIRYMQGEEDGLTALMHSAGAAVHKAWRPRLETPIVQAKGEEDRVFDAIKDLVNRDILSMGPPSRHMIINGISHRMTREQYEKYLEDSSAIVRRKLSRTIASIRWNRMSDARKIKVIASIIKNARKKIRNRIKRMMLRKKYRQLATG